jgi:hypothetical protein
MIDASEPLSLVLWAVFFFAASMYPLGFMLGSPCSACCQGPFCLMYRGQGWSGSAVDAQTLNSDGTFQKYDETQSTYSVSRQSGTPTGVLGYSTTVVFSVGKITATISGTYTLFPRAWENNYTRTDIPFSITLSRTGEYDLRSGEEYVLSVVDSSSIPPTVDEYGRLAIDDIGSFSVQLATGVNRFCVCNCEPWFYGDSEAVRPSTYSLTFLSSRSPDPMLGVPNSYSGFMPPAPYNGGPGCFNFVTRLLSPIVMRKVAYSPSIYISDPIPYSPCRQVVYQLDACTGELGVALLGFATRTARVASGLKLSRRPNCLWGQAAYASAPKSYSQEVNSHVFDFGFATASPGGAYAPESVTSCDGLSDSYMFLSEGCNGKECPKDIRISLDIDVYPSDEHLTISNNVAAGGYRTWYTYDSVFADRSGINGDYVVGYTSPQCPESGGLNRGQYSGLFAVPSGGTVSIVIERGKNAPAQQACQDCNEAGMLVGVSWSGIPIPGDIRTRTTNQGAYPVDAGPLDTMFTPGTFGHSLTSEAVLSGFSASGGLSSGNLCFPMCGTALSGSREVTGTEKLENFPFTSFYTQTGTITWTLT